MGIIGIDIPELNAEQEIEVDVKVNGIKRQYHYRIEIFYWEDCPLPTESRSDCIRHLISTYDPGWTLAHIGVPTEDHIALTFRKKR